MFRSCTRSVTSTPLMRATASVHRACARVQARADGRLKISARRSSRTSSPASITLALAGVLPLARAASIALGLTRKHRAPACVIAYEHRAREGLQTSCAYSTALLVPCIRALSRQYSPASALSTEEQRARVRLTLCARARLRPRERDCAATAAGPQAPPSAAWERKGWRPQLCDCERCVALLRCVRARHCLRRPSVVRLAQKEHSPAPS